MYKAIRYIGSKQKVLNFLEEELFSLIPKEGSFYEGFSGTGIISQYLTEKRKDLIISKSAKDAANNKSINLDELMPKKEEVQSQEIKKETTKPLSRLRCLSFTLPL